MSLYRIKGTSGPVLNQAFPLDPSLVLGGSAATGVRLESLEQAGDVLELVREAHSVRLRVLDSGVAVFLNGEQVSDATLGSGDEIRLASCRFILQAPGLRPQRVLDPQARVRRAPHWPWVALAVVLAGSAAVAWWQGWLPF